MNKAQLIFATFLCATTTVAGQPDSNSYPAGKPFMKLYSNYHSTFSEGESVSEFEVTRLYVGYSYQFSNEFSAKLNLDVGDPGSGDFNFTTYLKNAYLNYQYKNITLRFGMIPTTMFNLQEQSWGFRYISKSFQDKNSFYASADLGISAKYEFSNHFQTDLIIANGEGYKSVQNDSTLRYGMGVTFLPQKKLLIRLYTDYSRKQATTLCSTSSFIQYSTKRLSIGAEYNKQYNYSYLKHHHLQGESIYGQIKLNSKLKLLARHDRTVSRLNQSDTTWTTSKTGNLIIAGIEYKPIKHVRLSPNYTGWYPNQSNLSNEHKVELSCEVSF